MPKYLNTSAYRQVDPLSGTVYEPGVLTSGDETDWVKNVVAGKMLVTEADASKPYVDPNAPLLSATGSAIDPIVNPEINSDTNGNDDAKKSAEDAAKAKPGAPATVADKAVENAGGASPVAGGGATVQPGAKAPVAAK